MIKVHIFHTGSVIVDQAIPYKENNPLAVTGFLRSNSPKVMNRTLGFGLSAMSIAMIIINYQK